MDQPSHPKPSLAWRIIRFPLTRIILLGGLMLLALALNNGFMTQFAASSWLPFASTTGMVALAFAVYYCFVRFIEQRPASELALPGMGRKLGAGLLIGAALYAASVLLLMIPGIYRIDGMNPWHLLLTGIAAAISSGVLEELLFRGVLFRIVEESLGSWISLVVSSLFFGISHLTNPGGTLAGALCISVEAGVMLAAAYMLTRSLWLSIGIHIAWNYTQSAIFSGIVSGNEGKPGLIRTTAEGPALLTGGSFGIEASVIALLLCTGAGVVLLIMAVRRGNIIPPFWRRTH